MSIIIPSAFIFLFYGMMQARIKREALEAKTVKVDIKKKNNIQGKIKESISDFLEPSIKINRVGGAGYSSISGGGFLFGLNKDSLIFVRESDGERSSIPFLDVVEFETSGPGRLTTNAGVSGGGFGLEGFLQGAVAATILNAATSKTSVNTFLRVLTKEGEIYLHTSQVEPEDLKMKLSILSVSMAGRIKNKAADEDFVVKLERLQEMMLKGLITQSDYDLAKRRLLE